MGARGQKLALIVLLALWFQIGWEAHWPYLATFASAVVVGFSLQAMLAALFPPEARPTCHLLATRRSHAGRVRKGPTKNPA